MTVWVLPVSMQSSMAQAIECPVDIEKCDVQRRRRLGDRARRDEVDTCVRVRGDVLERDASRELDQHIGPSALAHDRDARCGFVGRHVVEHDEIGTGVDGLEHLGAVLALDLHRATRPQDTRAA